MDQHAEIRTLMDRYCLAIDGGDAAGWLECFTDDATFRSVSNAGTHLEISGHGELRNWIGNYHTRFAPWDLRHVVSGTVAEIDGDTASSTTTYFTLMTTPDDGSVRIVTAGRYLDSLERDERGWRIAERTARRDLGNPA